MKTILIVFTLFLSASFTYSQEKEKRKPDLCGPHGPKIVKVVHGYKKCMMEHLSSTGVEGAAKKCGQDLNFEGGPGQETDKQHCQKNNKILYTAMHCTWHHGFHGMKALNKNHKFKDCVKQIPREPGVDYGLGTEIMDASSKMREMMRDNDMEE